MARILIVEDARLTRRMIGQILRQEGHEVLEASGGLQGLELAIIGSFDCIFLDLLMPDIDGREFLQILRDEGLKIPVVVITADIQETTREECLNLGAIAVMKKVLKPDILRQGIKIAIAAKETVR
jgi:CheY-like chemotaxis protein